MILSDIDIIKATKNDDLILQNPDGISLIRNGRPQDGLVLEAHGIDLRVNRIRSWRRGRWIDWNSKDDYSLRPGELIIIETYENMAFSKNLAGTVHSRARLSLLGIMGISTTIHPGWPKAPDGNIRKPAPIYVALNNHGPAPVTIRRKEPVCRLLVHSMTSQPETDAPSVKEVTEMAEAAFKEVGKRIGLLGDVRKRAFQVLVIGFISGVAYYSYTIYKLPLPLVIFSAGALMAILLGLVDKHG